MFGEQKTCATETFRSGRSGSGGSKKLPFCDPTTHYKITLHFFIRAFSKTLETYIIWKD